MARPGGPRFHHCDLLLERAQGRIYVHGDNIRLDAHKGVSEIIDFRGSEPDVIAFYGDPERSGTQIDALEHYIDVSDVENAVKVYRKLPVEVRGKATPEEFEKAQFMEKDLEDHLEQHLNWNGDELRVVCPENTAVRALRGRYGSYVNRLILRCRPLIAGVAARTLYIAGSQRGDYSWMNLYISIGDHQNLPRRVFFLSHL